MNASASNDHAATVRRQLGELGSMSAQTEKAERDILDRAEKRLAELDGKMAQLKASSLTSDQGGQAYTDAVEERGRLMMVIAQANQILTGAPQQ